jgi:hypothetical protein
MGLPDQDPIKNMKIRSGFMVETSRTVHIPS